MNFYITHITKQQIFFIMVIVIKQIIPIISENTFVENLSKYIKKFINTGTTIKNNGIVAEDHKIIAKLRD